MKPNESTEQMLEDMVAGFETLYEEIKSLRSKNKCLQARLDAMNAKKKCKDSQNADFPQHPSTPTATEDGKEPSRSPTRRTESATVAESPTVQKACDIVRRRKANRAVPPKIELPQGHPQVEMEKDFTTPGGSQGKLGCPFATMMAEKGNAGPKLGRKGRRPGEASVANSRSTRDPIAAEFHSASGKSQPQSAFELPPQCPIRFLDQHKPEEVAKYFENHKHEIPRSHEVCIKRYQSNEQSIQKLDAKYGNLVSMIQGLGKKHKPILEEKVDEDEEIDQALSDKEIAKIQKWAGNVSKEPAADTSLAEQLSTSEKQDQERQSRFEKKLSDIRLGESPSRPWGIQVPEHAQKIEKETPMFEKDSQLHLPDPKDRNDAVVSSSMQPAGSMTFNGPVFFGYSPDEMARLLQQVPDLQKTTR